MVLAGKIENGVVVLEHGASLPEGTQVSVVVAPAQEVQRATQEERLADSEHRRRLEIIERIAALPIEGDTDAFSGRDHDRILYGNSS